MTAMSNSQRTQRYHDRLHAKGLCLRCRLPVEGGLWRHRACLRKRKGKEVANGQSE